MLSDSPVYDAFLATLVAGFMMTALGSAFVFTVRNLDERINNWMLAFAAGIMLSATFFSLLLPSMEVGQGLGNSAVRSAAEALIALLIGGGVLALVHRLVPHEHFLKGPEGATAEKLKRIWLLVFAIGLHNFPEGLAVGVAAASGDAVPSAGVALGIGIQNIPEGLSIAVALRSQGYRRRFSFGVAAFTGAIEVVGGVVGAVVLTLSAVLLPAALAFAAGAMLFVVSSEIIPETHRHGFETGATTALFTGFGGMMYLDALLGG